MWSAPRTIALCLGLLFWGHCVADAQTDWRLQSFAGRYPTAPMAALADWAESVGDHHIVWTCTSCASETWAGLWVIPHTDVKRAQSAFDAREQVVTARKKECETLSETGAGRCVTSQDVFYDKAPGYRSVADMANGLRRKDTVLINARETLHAVAISPQDSELEGYVQGLAYWVLLRAQKW